MRLNSCFFGNVLFHSTCCMHRHVCEIERAYEHPTFEIYPWIIRLCIRQCSLLGAMKIIVRWSHSSVLLIVRYYKQTWRHNERRKNLAWLWLHNSILSHSLLLAVLNEHISHKFWMQRHKAFGVVWLCSLTWFAVLISMVFLSHRASLLVCQLSSFDRTFRDGCMYVDRFDGEVNHVAWPFRASRPHRKIIKIFLKNFLRFAK